MLVLTRKLREQIRIGDNVTITILRIRGGGVRVGIDAPQEVPVVRGELPPKASSPAAADAAHKDDDGVDRACTSDEAELEPALARAQDGAWLHLLERGFAGSAATMVHAV